MVLLKSRSTWVVASVALIGVLYATSATLSAEPPPASSYAPAEDLVDQADRYIQSLEGVVQCEEDYNDWRDKLAKDSSTLAVIALVLGLHDEPNKYQDSAGALIDAAQQVAGVKDYPSAKRAVVALKEAAEGKRKSDRELTWERVASLPELMKQVPLIHTKLKRNLKGEKFVRKAKCSAGEAAVLATIAQGTIADASAAKSDQQAKQWRAFSAAARDRAGELNAAIRKGDEKAAGDALEKLNISCEDCHAVFVPEKK